MGQAGRELATEKHRWLALQMVDQMPLEAIEKSGLVLAGKVAVGDLAWVMSHGRLRRGVVVQVGRSRATVMLATDNAIRVARAEIAERAKWNVDQQARVRGGTAAARWGLIPAIREKNPDRAAYLKTVVAEHRQLLLRMQAESWRDVVRFVFAKRKMSELYKDK